MTMGVYVTLSHNDPVGVAQVISGVSDANAWWYLEEWKQGRDPPCCAKCADVLYKPDPIRNDVRVDDAGTVLEKKVASCQSVAAMHTGHKKAELIRDRLTEGAMIGDAFNEARARYKIVLEKSDAMGPGKNYWHVVSYDDGAKHDATIGMRTR